MVSKNYYLKGDSIYQFAHSALQQARRKNDKYLQAKSYENLASWHYGHGKELLVKYESDQKDKTISTQNAQLTQQRQIQWLSISVAGLFLLLSGVLYWVYRNNRRTSQQLGVLNQNLVKKIKKMNCY